MTESEKPASNKGLFYGYVVVAAAFVITLTALGGLYSYGVFFQPLLNEFGWSRATTSIAYSLSLFLHGLFYIVTGRLNDKFGPRIVLTVCGFFLGAGYLLMAVISDIWQLYLFYGVLIAAGIGGVYVPLVSTVARWFGKSRAMMTGIVLAGASVGTMIVPPIAEWLIETRQWRASFVIIGIATMVLIITAAQFLRQAPSPAAVSPEDSAKAEKPERHPVEVPFQQAIHTRQFWLVLVVLFCQRFAVQAIMVHIVPNIIDQGISAIAAASILTVIGGVSLAGRLVMGGLADRLGDRPIFAVCFIIMSAALFALPATTDMWPLYLFAVAFGLAYGGMYTLGSPLVAELFGLRSHGVILGVASFGGTIGGAIGPALAGYIFDIRDSYQLAFLTCGIISAIGLLAVLLIRPLQTQGGANDQRRSPGRG